MSARIGFMQGRLSPQVGGKIQAFPWEHWRAEFAAARALGFDLMEWTLDAERLYENPFMTPAGQEEIAALSKRYGVEVRSLTADFFMQAPFHKGGGAERQRRIDDLVAVCEACARLSVSIVVIPLVDAGRMETPAEEAEVLKLFAGLEPGLGVTVAFECDYPPRRLARFIGELGPAYGINYDIGNSASLGYDPVEEIEAYGARIRNVHVKDRVRGGSTVALGAGNANFPAVFAALRKARYAGDYILQTARAADGDHGGALTRYRDMTAGWIGEARRAA